uniref:Uncharacterized protein n=1 Tax=Rhizophora mucronata TaxID=61149 RepID=A0A2P2N907_RHIMU
MAYLLISSFNIFYKKELPFEPALK